MNLKVIQLQLKAYGSDYTIDFGSNGGVLNNTLIPLNDTVTIKKNGVSVDTLTDIDGNKWRARSRLLINADSENYQTLDSNQKIEITLIDPSDPDSSTTPSISNSSILFNYPVSMSGADIDASIYNPSTGEYSYKLKVYSFTQTGDYIRTNGLLRITGQDNETKSLSYTFKVNTTYLIPVNVSIGASTGNKITLKDENDLSHCYIYDPYNNTKKREITESGNYILKVDNESGANESGAVSSIDFTFIGDDNIVLVDYINIMTGFNDEMYYITQGESGRTNIRNAVYEKMYNYDTSNNFNWVYRVPENKKVEKPLDSKSFWDINHPYNAYTIAQ